MTRRQANLISNMIRSQTTAAFHEARKELLASCEEQKSDAAAPQPSVTVTATASQSEPVPPSTPKPLDSGWWKFRQAEALQEHIVIIADQRETIVELKKRIEYGDKHNNELVAANAEIHQSLRHWGLEQSEPCSLVNNVKQVIQLCAERGKKIEDMQKVIDVLSKQQPSDDRVNLRSTIDILQSENALLCERIRYRLAESKTLSASIHKSRERIEELMETVNRHVNTIEEKNKAISELNDQITRSGEAMTMLGVDNKKLNEALETLASVNQKMADNVAKLRHEKDSDEASYIKKLSHKSLRISVLKKVGNDLCACLKRYHYSDTQQPQVVSALRNWEKEAL